MNRSSPAHYRDLFVGLDIPTPRYNQAARPYINFDNAASTPPFKAVQEAVNNFLPYYSSVHRGTGYKSQLSTQAFEEARQTVLEFVQADPTAYICIFGKNTTEAINKLARRFPFKNGRDIVITTGMEHHSNDLPWRNAARTIHTSLTPEGRLDEDDFDRKVAESGDRLALVAVTGASNVTGFINPVHRLAEKTHAHGAQILVDCAQLAPHRAINIGALDDPAHLDYITLSAHKMYAPFGTGALIGLRETFEEGEPDYSGGGTVEIVTLENVVWTEPPERDEAGSPNTVGAIAMAAAIRQLEAIGMDEVAHHETNLTAYALQKLKGVPGLHIYGDVEPSTASNRLGVIPILLEEVSHFKVSAILGNEFGIGVRSGCFCAHPYLLHLLGLSPEQAAKVRHQILTGDRMNMPGMVRISFGLYNTCDEVDMLIDALHKIRNEEYLGSYYQEKNSGEYRLTGWSPELPHFF